MPTLGCPLTARQIHLPGAAGSRSAPRRVIQRHGHAEHRGPVAPDRAASTHPRRHAVGSPADRPVLHGKKLITWADGPKMTPFHQTPIGRQPGRPGRAPNRTDSGRPGERTCGSGRSSRGKRGVPGGWNPAIGRFARRPEAGVGPSVFRSPCRAWRGPRARCARGRRWTGRCGSPPVIVADRPSTTASGRGGGHRAGVRRCRFRRTGDRRFPPAAPVRPVRGIESPTHPVVGSFLLPGTATRLPTRRHRGPRHPVRRLRMRCE